FIGGKIDDAIRDHNINRVVGQRNVLDFAFKELDVLNASPVLVLISKRKHLIRHVEAIGFTAWADAPCGEQNVDTAAGAKIQNDFSGIQFREGAGIPATE